MTLDLSRYKSEFRPKKDIVHALIWNALKKYITSVGLEHVMFDIKSVKLSSGILTIGTGKSLTNTELKMREEDIILRVNESLQVWKEKVMELRVK